MMLTMRLLSPKRNLGALLVPIVISTPVAYAEPVAEDAAPFSTELGGKTLSAAVQSFSAVWMSALESFLGSSGFSSETSANSSVLRPLGASSVNAIPLADTTEPLVNERQVRVLRYGVIDDRTIRAVVSTGSCDLFRPYIKVTDDDVFFAVVAGDPPGGEPGACNLSASYVAIDITVPNGIGPRNVIQATVPQSELH